MGDAYVDVITDEEKAILQGEEPKPPAPDAEKDEQDKGPDTLTEKEPEGEKLPEGEKVETEQTQEEKEQQKQAEEMGLEVVTDERSAREYLREVPALADVHAFLDLVLLAPPAGTGARALPFHRERREAAPE